VQKYVSCSFEGYDHFGKAQVRIDFAEAADDFEEELGKKQFTVSGKAEQIYDSTLRTNKIHKRKKGLWIIPQKKNNHHSQMKTNVL
jgi:hypothetical protein